MSNGLAKAFGESEITWINRTITAVVSSLLNQVVLFDESYNASSDEKSKLVWKHDIKRTTGFIREFGKKSTIYPGEKVVKWVTNPVIRSLSVQGRSTYPEKFRVSNMIFHASQGSTVGIISAFRASPALHSYFEKLGYALIEGLDEDSLTPVNIDAISLGSHQKHYLLSQNTRRRILLESY